MSTVQTTLTKAEADVIEYKNNSRTYTLRRIAAVAGNEEALKAELQRIVECGIGTMGHDHTFLNSLRQEGYLLRHISVAMLNEVFTNFINCAYVGLLCAAEIKHNKEKVLTIESFASVINSAEEAAKTRARTLIIDSVAEGIESALKSRRSYFDYPLYIYEGKPDIFEAKKITLKGFFDLYQAKMSLSPNPKNASFFIDVTCPDLQVYKSDAIFESYKMHLSNLVQEEQFKDYKDAVTRMIAELQCENMSAIRPYYITILANAAKMLKCTEQLNTEAGQKEYQLALRAYESSVEALKKSPVLARNRRNSIIVAWVFVATLVALAGAVALAATITLGGGLVAALLLSFPLIATGMPTVMNGFMPQFGANFRSLDSRFKHTTLFAELDVRPTPAERPLPVINCIVPSMKQSVI